MSPQQLSKLKALVLAEFPNESTDKVARSIDDLDASGMVNRAAQVDDEFIDFVLPNHSGQQRNLAGFRK